MKRRSFLIGILAALGSVPGVEAYQALAPRKVGYLSAAAGRIPIDDAFEAAMKSLGYVEGPNITFHRRYLGRRTDNARRVADELVALNPDVLVVWSPPLASAVKATGTNIPVVFLAGGAAVELGFVASLARPGGNMTGIAFQPVDTLLPKYLEIAKELVPKASRFTLLAGAGETARRRQRCRSWDDSGRAAGTHHQSYRPGMNRRRFLLTSLAGALAGPLAGDAQQAGGIAKVIS